MGLRVQNFWTYMSFGLLGYDMSRTHSIMRIATTASPVSGAAVRGRMQAKALANEWDEAHKKVLNSVYMRRARMNENSEEAKLLKQFGGDIKKVAVIMESSRERRETAESAGSAFGDVSRIVAPRTWCST